MPTGKTKTMPVAVNLDELMAELGISAAEVEEERRKRRREQELYSLRELRSMKQITQTHISEILGVTQNRVSKLERYEVDRLEIRTLRKYLEALGGTLVISVDLNGERHDIPLGENVELD